MASTTPLRICMFRGPCPGDTEPSGRPVWGQGRATREKSLLHVGRDTMPTTRRTLIDTMTRLGGAAAGYQRLAPRVFLKPPPAMRGPLELPGGSGRRMRV